MDVDSSLPEEFTELTLEKSIQANKTAEELEKLTVDERLPPIERAVYLLSSGQDVQRISVITTLPDLLKENNAECIKRVVPKVREVLHVAQADMQLAACSAFLQILQKDLVPVQNYTQTFLQTILLSLDSRDPEVANAWLETLLDVIDLLPKDLIRRDILPVAIAKGQITKNIQSRLSCCRILGKIATKFEPFVIKKDILPTVQSLCQDVEYEVRACMCEQLDAVARGLGLEQAKSAILPELVELTKDEETTVQLAGLETVVQILSLLDETTMKDTILPLVCTFCQTAITKDKETLPAVAKHIGRLAHGLLTILTDEDRSWFMTFYKKLCKFGLAHEKERKDKNASNSVSNTNNAIPKIVPEEPSPLLSSLYPLCPEKEDPDVECRKNAAFNLPAMVLFVGVKNFRSDIYNILTLLCSDPNYKVRKNAAAGFHEIVKYLNAHSHLVLGDLIVLLKDDSCEVLQGLVAHLPETLEILHKAVHGNANPNLDASKHHFSELMIALTQAEAVIALGHNWRLQEEFIMVFTCLPSIFTSDQIYHKIIPMLYVKLHTARALPVRVATCKTLLILLRNNHRLCQRQEMCQRLIQELCHSQSCRDRSLFIDLCKLVLEIFSRAFFKENFYVKVLSLINDPVVNVRIRMCPFLPRLKKIIKLPTDRAHLQNLESQVRRIFANENVKTVKECLHEAIGELDKVAPQMESLTKKPFCEEDVLDVKKEEEEKRLLEVEEKERKEEEAKSARGERKKDQKSASGKDSKIPGPKKAIPTRKNGYGKSLHSRSISDLQTAGSKIPAATALSNHDKVTTRPERSGSFQGTSSAKDPAVKRTTSFNNKMSSRSKISTTSTTNAKSTSPHLVPRSSVGAIRKSSASSTPTQSRRSSIPSSTPTGGTAKTANNRKDTR